MKIIIALISIMISKLCYAEYHDRKINLNIHKSLTLTLDSSPQSIEIGNPDVIQVERVGYTNSIKITSISYGYSNLTIKYLNTQEVNYVVQVKNSSFSTQESYLSGSVSQSALLKISKEVQSISDLNTLVENDKIMVFGNLLNDLSYQKYLRIVINRPHLFIANFKISDKIGDNIVKFINNELKNLHEYGLNVVSYSGLFYLHGSFRTVESKDRVLPLIYALLPGVINNTESYFGDVNLVQMNIFFLEVMKDFSHKIGFKLPGMDGNISLETQFSEGKDLFNISPIFKLINLKTLFSALNTNGVARSLANPTLVTRCGEKASFLAGGEIPIHKTSNNEKSTEYKPYGIQFNAIPYWYQNNSVWLQLDIEVSEVKDVGKYEDSPSFDTRKIKTNVILNAGNSIILSGLTRIEDKKNIDRFPILGSIPIIGELFKSRRFMNHETELWIIIAASKIFDDVSFSQNQKVIKENFNRFNSAITPSIMD